MIGLAQGHCLIALVVANLIEGDFKSYFRYIIFFVGCLDLDKDLGGNSKTVHNGS